ncbi:disease resistance protein Pik-2-like [Typha angustifolia]|uniref:disease resistance protein Pik-2-like n=1 Tax=Typha angustifolia TaxID=59011 RepID=UPI003C2BE2D4
MEGAVVSAAEGAVSALLGKLGSILAQEALRLARLRDEIQYIKDELESINALLRNLAKTEDHDVQTKVWMKQVREMAYDAEDCIDEFMHHIGKPSGYLRRATRVTRTLKARHRIATQIQSIKARAQHASERRSRYGVVGAAATTTGSSSSYGFNHAASSYTKLDPRLPSLFADESQLVGIEGRKDELLGWVMEENQHRLRVISIVGFGGLGKTTLAMMVYRSPSVNSVHFQSRAFITVSKDFDIKVLMRDMLTQLDEVPRKASIAASTDKEKHARKELLQRIESLGSGHENAATAEKEREQAQRDCSMKELIEKARNLLQHKRYVIVLDDIWAVSAWENIKLALPENHNGSIIIVTTRIETVANTCCSHNRNYIYNIQPLSEVESKELFIKTAFGPDLNSCPPELGEVPDAILKKCGGLPLAINSIGGLLASKPRKTKDEWQKVHDNLSSELETNPTLEGMKQILTLSYNDLPYYLRACFLYLSIFPEDYEIKRSILERRWMAEGFVSEKLGLNIEDVAETYFNELVNRNIIQPLDIDIAAGKVRTFRIHDMMHEIIVSKSIEENFACLLGNQFAAATQDKARRLSLHSCTDTTVQEVRKSMSLSHVRSLTMFNYVQPVLLDSPCSRLLRVLDLQGCRNLRNHHLSRICKIFQLRYLSLRNTLIWHLPSKIEKLKYLETLDIRKTFIYELPSGIVKLQHLKHLLHGFYPDTIYWTWWTIVMPKGIENMKALQTLADVSVNKYGVLKELGELTQLRKLGIDLSLLPARTETKTAVQNTLEKLSGCLRSLSLLSLGDKLKSLSSLPLFLQKLQICGSLGELPQCISSLTKLTSLTLKMTELEEDAIQILETIPSLLCLRLNEGSYKEKQLSLGPNGFPNLKLLVIEGDKVCEVVVKKGAAPKLEKLKWKLWGNDKMEGMSGIEHLRSIKEVELHCEVDENVQGKVNALTAAAETHPNNPRVILGALTSQEKDFF